MPEYLGTGDPVDRRSTYSSLADALLQNRTSFDGHWREIADFMMPRRVRVNQPDDRNRGDKRNRNIIDSTGRFAARTLSSGLHAGLTSPARPWLKLSTPDPDLAEFGPVREWLHVVTSRLLVIFATTNLYNVLPLCYGDLGLFGTGAVGIVEDELDIFRAFSYPVGSYALDLDRRGLVSTFCRGYELSVRQVVEEFAVREDGRSIDWSKVSAHVKTQWDKSAYTTPVKVTWLVKPNDQGDRSRLPARYLPFSSCYWETDNAEVPFLKETGFRTFPFMCPRWDITGEDIYGTDCPGMTALGDVKQLQIQQRQKGNLIKKSLDPPVTGPSSLRNQKVSLLPGDLTVVDTREGMQGLRPIHEVRLDGLQWLSADMSEVQFRIKRAFYEDLFLMMAHADEQMGAARPTAREIDERHEEKLINLGPALERFNDELLDRLIDRTYELMERSGFIPPPPAEVHGVRLRVEYISILSQAQKLAGIIAQDRLLQTVVGMTAIWKDAADRIDIDQLIDNYIEQLGTDPRVLRSKEDADALRADRAQQEQAAAGAEQALTLAKAAQAASQAPLGGQSTALGQIVGGQTPPPA